MRDTVLVVDDEPLVTRTITRALAPDFDVSASTSAPVALDRMLAGETFGAIVCDLIMADMTGMELHDALARALPAQAARMIFLTGGAFTAAAQAFVAGAGRVVLGKPFERDVLREAVRTMVRPRLVG